MILVNPFRTPSIAEFCALVLIAELTEYRRKKAEYIQGWVEKNHTKVLAAKRVSWFKNREKNIARGKRYCEKNRKRLQEYRRQYYKNKRHTDPSYKIHKLIQRQVLLAIKGKTKSLRTQEIIGCSFDHLKLHLESQFEKGMSWSNHGEVWHIDHVVPRASFDLTKDLELRRCYHFTNLQPLFAQENYEKSDHVSHRHGNMQPCLGL